MTPCTRVTDAEAAEWAKTPWDEASPMARMLADRVRLLEALRQMQAECWSGHPDIDYDALDVVSDILKEAGRGE